VIFYGECVFGYIVIRTEIYETGQEGKYIFLGYLSSPQYLLSNYDLANEILYYRRDSKGFIG